MKLIKLISAESLKKKLINKTNSYYSIDYFNQLIDEEPAIKNTVQQGRWISIRKAKNACINCGFCETDKRWPFCPICGSRMINNEIEAPKT